MTIVLLDNRGFGCIHRLQGATVGVEYNNLWEGCTREERMEVDFVAHARSLGAIAEKVSDLGELAARLREARQSPKTHVIVIDTDPEQKINLGGNWWDVAVVEQSSRSVLKKTLSNYQKNKGRQQLGW